MPSFKVFSLHVCFACACTCVALHDAHVQMCVCEEAVFNAIPLAPSIFFKFFVTGSLIGLELAK